MQFQVPYYFWAVMSLFHFHHIHTSPWCIFCHYLMRLEIWSFDLLGHVWNLSARYELNWIIYALGVFFDELEVYVDRLGGVNWLLHPILVVLYVNRSDFFVSINEAIYKFRSCYSELSGLFITHILEVTLAHRFEEKQIWSNFHISVISEHLEYEHVVGMNLFLLWYPASCQDILCFLWVFSRGIGCF